MEYLLYCLLLNAGDREVQRHVRTRFFALCTWSPPPPYKYYFNSYIKVLNNCMEKSKCMILMIMKS